jgi:ATP-dependent DNA helicase RecG
MITKGQIRFLLNDIENERVERTISTRDTDRFAKTICAFANDLPNKRQSGYLLIGVFDNGHLNGLKITDELLRNLAALRSDGNIHPKPALMVDKFSFLEGDVAVVEVRPSKNTPVKYKGITYVRIGAKKSEANEEEERILREKNEIKSLTFDTTPCTHSTIDDLDLDLFKGKYLPKFVNSIILKRDKRMIKQQLASLKLYDLTHNCPTVAGILLIGKDPKYLLFGAYIQYVQFAGKNMTSKVLNERQFSGNLLTMLNELDYFIKYTIQKQRPAFISVLREKMKINYPYEAIRELAMNLVMHRNYQTNTPAKFYEYSNRIEMDNPGNLYGKVNPDNFPYENDYRNPVIAGAMKAFGYVNRFGKGINMVQEKLELNKNGLSIFNFNDISTFKVTVMNADLEAVKAMEDEAEIVRKNNAENNTDIITEINTEKNTINSIYTINKKKDSNTESDTETNTDKTQKQHIKKGLTKITTNQRLILGNIDKNPYITSVGLSNLIGINASNIRANISKLKTKGLLERIGGDNGGYWKIKW